MHLLRLLPLIIATSLILAACQTADDTPEAPISPQAASAVSSTAASSSAPHSLVSLPALFERQFRGTDLTLGTVLDDNAAYTRHAITYESGDLTISGIMNIPKGEGPFPVIVTNHGYIDPAVYTTGRGLKREQDYLARRGFAVLHPDYRNHAGSDKDPLNDAKQRVGYAEDVINAVLAIRESDIPSLDKERIGMLGHSMGGGATLNAIVIRPELVKAAVLFAPVSGDAWQNVERWTLRNNERRALGELVTRLYGTPDTKPDFWREISAINYLDRAEAPVQIHHGTADKDVPLEWSQDLAAALERANKPVELHVYDGQPHEFTGDWGEVMRRTAEFYEKHL